MCSDETVTERSLPLKSRGCCGELTDWVKDTFMALLCPNMGAGSRPANSEFSENLVSHSHRRVKDETNTDAITLTPMEERKKMMIVKHSFVPYSEDELQVKAGQIVYSTHEENQWIYATTDSGEQGFVPSNCLSSLENCRQYREHILFSADKKVQSKKSQVSSSKSSLTELFDRNDISKEGQLPIKKIGDAENTKLAKSLSFGEVELGDYDIFGYISDSTFKQSESEESLNGSDYTAFTEPFVRKPHGKYLVLHNYHGEDEHDATILKGDCVTVLNKDDHDWYYVQTSEGVEGFAPRSYLWQATCAPDDDEDVIL